MKKIFKIILVFVGLFIFQNCSHHIDDKPLDIYLDNTSNEDIRFIFYFVQFEQKEIPMHYTSFLLKKHKVNISNGAIRTFDFKRNTYITIKIWKQSTIKRFSWEEIQQNHICDKKYHLTLDDIRNMNYTIIYDGN